MAVNRSLMDEAYDTADWEQPTSFTFQPTLAYIYTTSSKNYGISILILISILIVVVGARIHCRLLHYIRDLKDSQIIFTNPSARAGYDTRSIFKQSLTGLNSEFSFS